MASEPPFDQLAARRHWTGQSSGIKTVSKTFHIVSDERHKIVRLLAQPPGSRAAPSIIWTRRFESDEDRDALLSAVRDNALDLTFLGRLTMAFGPTGMDEIADRLVRTAHDERLEAEQRAAEKARKYKVIHLYARAAKRGYVLDLQRTSRDKADWQVVYDRAIERDRLCDWLRWQRERFGEFLDYAEKHGNEALTRCLTDEMFATERRVKKEGRGAGGTRPLRMWRGDR